uniref:NADH-plastoquinone oxidoreductase subunit 6 n=1 Tax=Pinguicula jackii TaxID=326271 RepID=A0A9E8AEJ0_9LAMI|nr:NADH-plastoquinone oxidoreductase subunit 6 [Pinguicula jackii]YP_010565368.1 NADH-plastoquinone oxidoreductase subunit 6 [Pinguicula jackii]UZA66285.1 NADH-plastoquinone oxidoreductase subunit 6 [Pinguicula jackii]UZA66286.1 NADH-plastoquinone oxidoreductase subunit 6 [Pinguicula jackii]
MSGIRSSITKFVSSSTLESNLFGLFIRIGSFFYIFILYSIELIFCSCCAATYLCRNYKCFNHFCCDVHEWFRILQRFSSLYRWGSSYFNSFYKYFYFTNFHYFRYVLVWDHLDYKI